MTTIDLSGSRSYKRSLGLLKDRLQREGRAVRSEVFPVVTPTGRQLRILLQLDDLYLAGFAVGDKAFYRFRGLKRWDGPPAVELPIEGDHRALKTAERSISLDLLRKIDRLADYRGAGLSGDQEAALCMLVVVVSEALRFTSVRQKVTGLLGGQIQSINAREMSELVRNRFTKWNDLSRRQNPRFTWLDNNDVWVPWRAPR
jgi:Ribosome inactivating protein